MFYTKQLPTNGFRHVIQVGLLDQETGLDRAEPCDVYTSQIYGDLFWIPSFHNNGKDIAFPTLEAAIDYAKIRVFDKIIELEATRAMMRITQSIEDNCAFASIILDLSIASATKRMIVKYDFA